jgi:hypothetical protein
MPIGPAPSTSARRACQLEGPAVQGSRVATGRPGTRICAANACWSAFSTTDQVRRILDVPLGQEAVHPQDAALDEPAGVAEVGHAARAVAAAGAAAPDRRDDVVAGPERRRPDRVPLLAMLPGGAERRLGGLARCRSAGRAAHLLDLAERLVAEHQAVAAGRSRAVAAGEDLAVRAADADVDDAHGHSAGEQLRRRHVGQLGRPIEAGVHDDRAHLPSLRSGSCSPRSGTSSRT